LAANNYYVFIRHVKNILFFLNENLKRDSDTIHFYAYDRVWDTVCNIDLYAKVIFENIGTDEVLKEDDFDMCTRQFLLKWEDIGV